MSILRRTTRSSTVTVVLLVISVTGILADAGAAADDDRALTETDERQRRGAGNHQHDRRQHASDCSAVHQFARQSMQYINVLPATKSHGTFSVKFPGHCHNEPERRTVCPV